MMRMRVILFLVALTLLGLPKFHSAFESLQFFRTSLSTNALSFSRLGDQTSVNPFTVLRNRAYTVYYSEELKNPAWVSYQLNQSDKLITPPSRPHIPFQADTRTSARVESRDFSHSGFDRGHMAPSHAIGAFYGPEAQAETFLLSNICPQNHKTNEGVWNSIERMEANDFAKRFGAVTVICGPVFDRNPLRLPSGIAVPKAFFKIIQRPDKEIICFIVPQDTGSPKPEDYFASLAEINSVTGLNILPEIPHEKKARARTKIW